MSPCFAGSKRTLEMVVYDPAAASKRARPAETTETSGTATSPSANAAALALHAASAPPPFGDFAPIHAVPISAVPFRPTPATLAGGSSGREEPPCLRRHFLVALGLRADLPVHFVAEKLVTATDLDAHQSRFRIPSDGVERRLRALLTPRELDDANLLHDPPPVPRKRPEPSSSSEPRSAAAEGEKMKKPKRKGKVHGGLRVKLVDLAAGARELRMSRWESSRGTIVKGEGYLDFVRRCSFGESDVVEIWAFVQRRVRLFGADVCNESLLHLLVVKKHEKRQCRYCSGAPLCAVLPPPTPQLNSSTGN
ncbi:unnamed protein product [Urochloa humidicola]